MPRFKPLTVGSLPRVFVNLLAQDDESIVHFFEGLSDSAEMATWFDLTKTTGIPISARNGQRVDSIVRRDLAGFFLAILNLSKVSRGMFVKDFARLLNELGTQDFWGTEGQCDPRGDRRD